MSERVVEILILINDFVMAAIVIFGSAVFLYNLRHSLRDRVTRAFNSLLLFVVIVYFTELIITRTTLGLSTEIWVKFEWIGIAMVPAALFHLSDALLVTTGDISRVRRILVRIFYIVGIVFFSFAIFSDYLVDGLVPIAQAPHLGSGILFPLFAIYFWLISLVSFYNVWRARKRCVTTTTRKRMSVIFVTFLAAPLSVFPYLTLSGDPSLNLSPFFWLIIILGNVTVSIMFAFFTYYIAYFGASSPDRVVRVRLVKFMARVPMTATIVLIVYVIASRADTLLGLPVQTAVAIMVVATIIIVEWGLHALKRPLERIFQLTDEPEVRRIQQLSERVLTTRDMRQFLESVLAASCEVLRTPSAFIAAFTANGPKLEAVVGPLEIAFEQLDDGFIKTIASHAGENGEYENSLPVIDEFIIWHDYWIRTLLSAQTASLVGIMGIKARSEFPDLTEQEKPVFDRLADQASSALEDRLLQQDVFAAVEGLLPHVTELQKRRSAATFGGAPVLTQSVAHEHLLTDDPDFNNMVWDALSHYWGGPKLTESPLIRLQVVQDSLNEHGNNPTRALRSILARAVEQQKPSGERSMTTAEWILYNILELKFIQGFKVRDVARRLAMSESDLYRKQRIAIENVAQTISRMEDAAVTANYHEDIPLIEPMVEEVHNSD